MAKQMEREADEDNQMKVLLAKKGAFSASGLWKNCGTQIGNAIVVLRAQKEQLELMPRKLHRNHKPSPNNKSSYS